MVSIDKSFLFKNGCKKSGSSKVTSPTFVDFSNKEIAHIDPKTFQMACSSLEILWLGKNQIEKIDANLFVNLTQLEFLSLESNQIAQLNVGTFRSLVNLTELFLDSNKLKTLQVGLFRKLKQLSLLSLSENELTELEIGAFDGLSALKKLNLHKNQLSSLDENIFEPIFEKLEVLFLSSNYLSEVNSKILRGFCNLTELGMQNNKLTRIEANTFKGLTQLKRLHLHNNLISDIHPESFDYFDETIKVITLFNNETVYMSFVRDNFLSWQNKLSNFEENIVKHQCLFRISHFLKQFEKSAIKNDVRPEKEVKHGIKYDITDELLNKRYRVKKRLGFGETLGCGSFAQVFLVFDEVEKKNKAIKIQDSLKTKEANLIHSNELKLLHGLKNENLIEYFDRFQMGFNCACIIVEYFENGDLSRHIEVIKNTGKSFEESTLLLWTIQATNALKFLHSNKIIHRDIKPSNIFLENDQRIKLGYLGYTRLNESDHFSIIGTKSYISPELLNGEYSYTTDIWSLGCVVYELLYLKQAYPNGTFGKPSMPDFGKSTFFSPILEK